MTLRGNSRMDNNVNTISRRSFMQKTSSAGAAGAAAFTIIKPELVRGAGKEMLKAGLVGCGGRGTQAVIDMMQGTENTQLVAIGDVFEDQLEKSLGRGRAHRVYPKFQERIKVEPDHTFVGFEAF